ncbi:MAG: hypothetical protein PHF40_01475 [Candidatus Pacebacteria bacterium]|nr:hypothetical protein [Candidatus Paceibacterota bacterium]
MASFFGVKFLLLGERFTFTVEIALVGLMMGIIGALFGMFIGVAVGRFLPTQCETQTVELVSLRNAESTGGTFFLGTGTVGLQEYYIYYQKTGDGYQLKKISVDDGVIIKEERREGGLLKVHRLEVQKKWKWLGLDWFCSNPRYEFVIPEGTLQQKFVIQ